MSYPPALFTYSVVPTTVACSGTTSNVVELMVAVNNTSGRDQKCQQIGLTVTGGAGAANLVAAADVARITAGAADGTHWTGSSGSAGSFIWQPDPGHELLRYGESVAFLLTGVAVSTVQGLVVLPVYETTDVPRVTAIDVTKTAPGLGISSFGAVPIQVDPGGTTLLTWTTTGAATCTLSDGQVTKPVPLVGTSPATPAATTSYTLTAVGQHDTVQQTVTVTVPEVRVLDFRADPVQLAQGATTTLTWATLGASSAQIMPGRHPITSPDAGDLQLPVTDDTRFSLQAVSPSRSDSQDVDVVVMPVSVSTFAVDPPVVEPGNTATLSWDVAWSSAVTITPGPGSVSAGGSHDVSPVASTTYRLHAAGKDAADASVTVGVGAAITGFGFGVDPGQPGILQVAWSTFVGGSGDVTLTVGGVAGAVAPTGTRAVPLTDGTWVVVELAVSLGSTSADASFAIKGPVSTATAALTTLRLTSAPGVNTPQAVATVDWVTSAGTVGGQVANAQGQSSPLVGATGSLPFAVGQRPPGAALWQGDLQLNGAPTVHWTVQ